MEALPLFHPESIDVIVTSPPYNLGIEYNLYDDGEPRQNYLNWMGEVFSCLNRVLKESGHFFLNVGSSLVDPWVAMEVAFVVRKHFILQNHIIWVKSITVGEETRGHFKPINSPRFLNHNWEHLFHFTKTGAVPIDRLALGVPYMDKSNLTRGTRGKNGDRRCGGNVWFVPYETISSGEAKGCHPAIYPEELVERCLKLAGASKGSVVLDPFLGTGTTLAVCQKLGIPGIGIEIDPAYVAFSARRLEIAG